MNETFKFGAPADLDRESFLAQFGGIYEHSDWIAARAYDQGITDKDSLINNLHQRFADIFLAASRAEQLAVINAHPDLAGRAARAGELTQASTNEQLSAGIDSLTTAEFDAFKTINHRYKAQFGFPFIMAVKGSNKHQILAGFNERINNTPEQEFDRALSEINKIAALRLAAL